MKFKNLKFLRIFIKSRTISQILTLIFLFFAACNNDYKSDSDVDISEIDELDSEEDLSLNAVFPSLDIRYNFDGLWDYRFQNSIHFSQNVSPEFLALPPNEKTTEGAEIFLPKIPEIDLNELKEEILDFPEIISDVNYFISYDNKNLVSLTIRVESFGASLTTADYYLNYDLDDKTSLKIEDVLDSTRLEEMTELADQKLQENVNKVIFSSGIDPRMIIDDYEFSFEVDHFKDFSLTNSGIIFYYPFNFPSVNKAYEPRSEIFFSFEELNEYLVLELP